MKYKQRMEVNKEHQQIIIEEGWVDPKEPLLTRITHRIYDAREEMLREGLKQLGWLSPEEAQALYQELDDAEDELRVHEERNNG